MSETTEVHPQFPKFQLKASIDVDAGSIWIGDGCYVLKDPGEARPKDLGDDWHGICERFFERSGYNASHSAYSDYRSDCTQAILESPEGHALIERQVKLEIGTDEYKACSAEVRELITAYQKEHPFESKTVDTGIAEFTHDLGHGGMGVMVSTFYGDGSYPVYVEYGENGRPRRILIDFDPGGDDEEDELQQEAA